MLGLLGIFSFSGLLVLLMSMNSMMESALEVCEGELLHIGLWKIGRFVPKVILCHMLLYFQIKSTK